jgi:TetR/AcrR family transcriptional repressor of uid operon
MPHEREEELHSKKNLPTPEGFLETLDQRLSLRRSQSADSRDRPLRGRRVGRPTTSEAGDTRNLILSAALQCFGRQGYDRTTNSEIARSAGVSPPTIYHYFDSKASLFQAVSNITHRRVFELVATKVATANESKSRISSLVKALSEIFEEEPDLAGFISNYAVEVRRNPEVLRLSPPELWTGPVGYFSEIALLGKQQGEIASEVDPDAIAGIALCLLYGLSTLFTVNPDREFNFSAAKVLEMLIEGTLFTEK